MPSGGRGEQHRQTPAGRPSCGRREAGSTQSGRGLRAAKGPCGRDSGTGGRGGAVSPGLGGGAWRRGGACRELGGGASAGGAICLSDLQAGAGPGAGRSRAASLGAGLLPGGDLHHRPSGRGRGLRAGRRRGGDPGSRTSKVADRAAAARPSLSRNVVGQLQLAHAAVRRGLGAGDAGVVLAARPSASTGSCLLAAPAADLAGEMSAGRMDLLGLTPGPSLGS